MMTDQVPMPGPVKPVKPIKPRVFDDKSTGLKCLTFIIVAMLFAMVVMAKMLPESETTNVLILALVNIVATAVGGIVGIVTGSKWAVRQESAELGSAKTSKTFIETPKTP